MPFTTIHNKQPAAAIDHGGLDLVWTTTLPLRKDSTNDLYHIPRAPFKSR